MRSRTSNVLISRFVRLTSRCVANEASTRVPADEYLANRLLYFKNVVEPKKKTKG